MAGEGEFLGRREDADPGAVRRTLRRQHEYGLGEIELGGNGKHLRVVQTLRVEDDGKLVAGQRGVGEDVEDGIGS